jgi:hypothetical protein
VSAFRVGLRPAGQPPKLPPYLLPLWRELVRCALAAYDPCEDDAEWLQDDFVWAAVSATQRDLADALDCAPRTIVRQLAAMRQLDWLQVNQHGGHGSAPNTYGVRVARHLSDTSGLSDIGEPPE